MSDLAVNPKTCDSEIAIVSITCRVGSGMEPNWIQSRLYLLAHDGLRRIRFRRNERREIQFYLECDTVLTGWVLV